MREDHAETLRYEDLKINNNSSDEDLVLGKLDRNDEEMLETPRPPDTGVKDFGNEKEKAKETVKEKENSVKEEEKDFQIIVLGATGGPVEDNVTGLLVRSTAEQWTSRSLLAVDAGTLLGGILRILSEHLPQSCAEVPSKPCNTVLKAGPFAGLTLPHVTAKANAAYIFRELLGAVCVTHPHLDHMSALAINTPLIQAGKGPKTVTALPSAIAAIREHVFNDITWPNLSDEDDGAGFVTYQRLVEGGNPRFGFGEARGYVQVVPGIGAKCLPVSHGRCNKRFSADDGRFHRAGSRHSSRESLARRLSQVIESMDPYSSVPGTPHPGLEQELSPWSTVESSAFFLRSDKTGNEIIAFGDIEPDSVALEGRNYLVWEAAAPKLVTGTLKAILIECSYDDSVDDRYLFGHLCPRHLISELMVLAEKVEDVKRANQEEAAAAAADATGIRKRKRPSFQVGFTNAVVGGLPKRTARNVSLSGMRSPTWQYGQNIGGKDGSYFSSSGGVGGGGGGGGRRESRGIPMRSSTFGSNFTMPPPAILEDMWEPRIGDSGALSSGGESPTAGAPRDMSIPPTSVPQMPLEDKTPLLLGLKVFIIHVKDTLEDGPSPGVQILKELEQYKKELNLGCEFHVAQAGETYFV